MSAGTARTYPIRAVARLTGVAIDTLRAWERRYGAVTPARDGRGRVYTDEDVARLYLLQRAVQVQAAQGAEIVGHVGVCQIDRFAQLAARAAVAQQGGRGWCVLG